MRGTDIARVGAGLAVGAVTAVAHLVLAVPATLVWVLPAARPAMTARGCELALAEAVAVTRGPTGDRPPWPRAARYLLNRIPIGLLGGAVLGLLVAGVVVTVTMLWSWITATPFLLDGDPPYVITGVVVAYWAVPGVVLLYLGLAGAAGVARWERTLAARLLAPSREEQLALRVEALARSRAAVVAAVDDERRRIERDLHDGVQQRVVALGMLLGRARRHPGQAPALLEQAHQEAGRVLTDLRDVSWRVYPAALDTGGLAAALESVAERAPLPVDITCRLAAEPPGPVRAAAWFVVCEAVTNAAKHAQATAVTVRVETADDRLCASIRDDGRGGADPHGGGLSGLARRVAAADGTLTVTSPTGGPTVIRVELPCG